MSAIVQVTGQEGGRIQLQDLFLGRAGPPAVFAGCGLPPDGFEGAAALDVAVRAAMTPKVKICNESHTVNEIMEIMTTGRFRHLPVEKHGLLDGIVSIGDVVKRRIEVVEREAEEIRAYIATA